MLYFRVLVSERILARAHSIEQSRFIVRLRWQENGLVLRHRNDALIIYLLITVAQGLVQLLHRVVIPILSCGSTTTTVIAIARSNHTSLRADLRVLYTLLFIWTIDLWEVGRPGVHICSYIPSILSRGFLAQLDIVVSQIGVVKVIKNEVAFHG